MDGPHWVCLVFPRAQIQVIQAGQDLTHMMLWPSPTSLPEVGGVYLPPSRWCQLGLLPRCCLPSRLCGDCFSNLWSTLRQHTCPDPHQHLHPYLASIDDSPPSQSRPRLMWNRGCVLQHPPYLSASILAWGSPLLLPPWPTYFLNYLFVCLLSSWTYSPLLFWLPLMILLSQIWQMGTPMPFQHTPSFFSYISQEFIQKAPIPVHPFRISPPSSLSASFFLHLQREPCLPDPRYILPTAQSYGPHK